MTPSDWNCSLPFGASLLNRGTGIKRRMKRALDVVAAGTGIIVFSPVLLGTALAIRLSMGRPIFFRQERPGLDGNLFTIYKFRSMREPRGEEVWFRSDEDRLTLIGKMMRKTSVDELPELWNVLRGDMSLVGPRPLLVEYMDKYTPEENRRHNVLPGITGWAQVNGRQDIPFSKRLELDVWYVDHWNLALDIRILFRTLAAVWGGLGVRSGQNVDDVDDLGLSADRTRV